MTGAKNSYAGKVKPRKPDAQQIERLSDHDEIGNERQKLTDKQRTFVYEYVVNQVSGTEAARRAGYKHPNVRAAELLHDKPVKEEPTPRAMEPTPLTMMLFGECIEREIINKYPNYIFLVETKADLLISYGYTEEAMKFYQKSFGCFCLVWTATDATTISRILKKQRSINK